jgi:DHA2 family multidrug resistance protein-like MFS transporter
MTDAMKPLPEAPAAAPARAGRREWIGLAVLMLPTLLIVMDLTVLHLAVPHLSADLQPSSAQLLWIVDIYGFMIAGSLITMGTLGDRIGRRRLLLTGAAAFAAASVLAAFSTSAAMLIASRAALGVAGATLMPSTMSLIRNMFLDPRERTAAIGLWVSGFSAGSAIGPLVGGYLLEHFWWGSVFLLGVPVMALLLVLGPRVLPEFRDPHAGRLDLLSAGLSLGAVLAVIYGLKQIAQDGLAAWPLAFILAGLLVGALFVRRQRRLADPLIDHGLFRVAAFSTSLVTYTLGVFVAFGSFLFIAQYLQLVLGLSPWQAGLWSLPGALTSIAGSNLAPVLVRRVRPAYVIAAGLALAALSFGLLTQAGVSSLALIVAAWTLMSFGFGLTFSLTADLVVGSAPAERAGAAAALSETGAEFGGALGLAVLGSIGIAIYRSRLAATAPAGVPAEAVRAAQETLAGAVAAAGQLPEPLGAALLSAAQAAFVQGLQFTAIIGTVVMAALVALCLARLRHLSASGEPGAAAEPEPAAAPAAGSPPGSPAGRPRAGEHSGAAGAPGPAAGEPGRAWGRADRDIERSVS